MKKMSLTDRESKTFTHTSNALTIELAWLTKTGQFKLKKTLVDEL